MRLAEFFQRVIENEVPVRGMSSPMGFIAFIIQQFLPGDLEIKEVRSSTLFIDEREFGMKEVFRCPRPTDGGITSKRIACRCLDLSGVCLLYTSDAADE